MDLSIRFDGDFESADFGEIDELFRAAGLGSRDPKRYRIACRRSYTWVLARDGDRIAGFGRLLSDGYIASAILDMAVFPESQGRGIGRRIMELLHEAVPRSTYLLFAVPGKESFCRKIGYYDCRTGMIRPSDPKKAAQAGYIELPERTGRQSAHQPHRKREMQCAPESRSIRDRESRTVESRFLAARRMPA